MEGNSSEDYGNGGVSSPREGISDGQRCQSVDSLAEWRSSEQVENGTPSTSPPFWDTEDDDDDCGPRPSELYGKFTWKIENFSQINKRELRSNAFEVGSYKWYILIYPQGCDVCNHLSLFLCVANHDKLLPGWSHFAQFTIAVVNKDPKKTKYSDTLHRFWKKEHDWGWKKFMELSKVLDGFINNDTLVIKAQVQVIREKANYLFRCLDCQYRREVLRVYLSNVEQICRTFFEERKKKLCDLIGDKIRWSSFCTFWLEIDQNSRRRMSKEKSDTILRVVVKHFFVEKEVTSTLVMDSLYSGLKALECQSKNKKERLKIEMDAPAPMVRVDKDMFVLSDDVLLLLERVASDPLPTISSPPKDDKVSQNRTKEGSSGEEFNKDSIERDERRLTELGRRTVEIFVLAHIFSSRIEVAYQEAVALKRQEELIREEEAAGQAENELKAKRAAAEKEKRTKKKQAKQKRNNRKNKDKQRDLKTDLVLNEKYQEENSLEAMASGELSAKQGYLMNERLVAQENAYDVSCTGDDVIECHYLDLEDRASSPLNWGMDASEVHPTMEASACEISNGRSEKMSSVLDDSSSTCSTDSVPSFVSNGPCKGNPVILNKSQISPNRVNTRSRKDSQNNPYVGRHSGEALDSCMSICPEPEADVVSLKHPIQSPERHLVEKQEATATLNKKTVKDQGFAERISSTRILESFSASSGPGRKPFLLQAKQPVQSSKIATNAATVSISVPAMIKEPPTSSFTVHKRASVSAKLLQSSTSQSEAQKHAAVPPAKDTAAQPVNAISRPSSAPLIPAVPKTNTPVISTVQVMPHLSRSVSAAGRFPMDPSSSAPSYGPQSYRNAIIGKNTMSSSATGFTYSVSSPLSQASTSSSHSSTTSTFSASMLPTPSTTIKEDRQQMASRPGFTFGSVKPEALHIQKQQRDDSTHNAPTSSSVCTASTTTRSGLYKSNIVNDIERLDICPDQRTKHYQGESLSSTLLSHGGAVDEFPHMDIINDLLDEEQSIMEKAVSISSQYHTHHQHHRSFSRQYSFPVDVMSADLGSISNSSGRFDQIDHYCNDGLQSLNGSSFGGGLHRMRDDHLAQVDLSAAYASGQMDGLIQGQWPYSHADLSIMNLSSSDGSGYSYQHLSDYANLGTRPNGYGLYRP